MKCEWKTVKLGDIAEFNKFTYSVKDEWKFVNYLDTGNITENRIEAIQYIDLFKESLPSRAKRKVKNCNIIYSTVRPNQLHYGYIKEQPNNFLVSTGFAVIDVNEEFANSQFIYYFLTQNSITDYLHSIAEQSVSAYPSIKSSDLADVEINLPDLETQKKIAKILSSLDDKIELNNAINHNLEAQASELFDAWFISFVRSDGKMPADWHKGTLGDIAAITSGKRPPMKQAVASVDATIPLVGAASIMGFTNAILYNEPILVTGRVGTHGVVQRFQSPCWTSDNTLVIKSDFYEYTFQVLQRVDYVNMNRGSTQPLITQTDLKNVSIVIPTEEVLLEYEKIAGSLMAMYESNRKENERLATLRDTLLPKLMSGEIDVSEVEL